MRRPNRPQRSTAPLSIRGHHLLCALGFRGLGYSKEFVANMTRVVRVLRGRPDALLRLAASTDSICAACPHLRRGKCSRKKGASARIAARDSAVLKRLALRAGAELTVAAAYSRVRDAITPEIMADEGCAGCSWWEYGYCAEGLRRLKQRRRGLRVQTPGHAAAG